MAGPMRGDKIRGSGARRREAWRVDPDRQGSNSVRPHLIH